MPLEGMYIGRYHFIRLLGSGGMGEVYLAEDPRIKQQVAIKVIRAESAPYPDDNATREASRLFEREAIAVAGLDHPHILPLFDYGEAVLHGNLLTYLVMPYRPEGSLLDWLHKRGSAALLSPREVAHIISQTAGALQHAHDRQIIHQDIKPSNLLIREQKETPNTPDILLADFGIARSTTGTASLSQVIRGTPTYMAPEQWEAQPVVATDQYALAVMAYELLTGRPPFQGGSVQMMYQHFNVQPEPASKINTSLLADVDAVLLQALAKKPRERFDSIALFAQAFRQAAQGTDVSTDIKPPQRPKVTRVPSFKMPVGPPKNDEIRATLTISQSEARTGINRKITLPGGRQVIVTVPAGAQDGQVIRLEGLRELSSIGGPPGTLIITLSVKQAEQTIIPSRIDNVAEKLPKPPVVAPVAAAKPPLIENQISIKRQAHSRRRAMLLIALALLVIAGSAAGIFGVMSINQFAAENASAIATATSGRATVVAQPTTTAVAQAQATASVITANPIPSYFEVGGNLAFVDPLSEPYQWQKSSDTSGNNCQFTGGYYNISQSQPGNYSYCQSNSTFTNFAFEVTMTIIQGDCGGIFFRANIASNTFYSFIVCQDRTYHVYKYSSNSNQFTDLSSYAPSRDNKAINMGLNQPNVIAVAAQGSLLTFYVNNVNIFHFSDTDYPSGYVGLLAYAINNTTQVEYSNARAWNT